MKYFGTDGIRGISGEGIFSEASLTNIFYGIANFLKKNKIKRVVLARDTRVSGLHLATLAIECFTHRGIDVVDTGILPTAAAGLYVMQQIIPTWAVVLSASHNPPQYNGIKLFDAQGHKLSLQVEQCIEQCIEEQAYIDENATSIHIPSSPHGTLTKDTNFLNAYVQYLVDTNFSKIPDFNHIIIAFDCAEGAASMVIPLLVKRLGLQAVIINGDGDGKKINVQSGSQNLQGLQAVVKKHKADMGFAFDGDADRVLSVDGTGRIINGDMEMALIASYDSQNDGKNDINNNLTKKSFVSHVVGVEESRVGLGLVGTVMAGLGLERLADQLHIPFFRVPVGDKHVLSKLIHIEGNLGGESSGHIIYRPFSDIGDGILMAVLLLKILHTDPQLTQDVIDSYLKTHHRLIAVPYVPLSSETWSRIEDYVNRHSTHTQRMVVRPSGTEPIIRIYAEAVDEHTVNTLIADMKSMIIHSYL